MNKILWLSPFAPYDGVRHAGGQIENYYLKKLNAQNDVDVLLISFINAEEYDLVVNDLERARVKNIIVKETTNYDNKIVNIIERYNRYGGIVQKNAWDTLKSCLDKMPSYKPDTIVIEWTEFVVFIPQIKLIYPNVKIVAIEEDVTFLKYNRSIEKASNVLKKISWMFRYFRLKNSELNALRMSDLVILNNPKDEKLVKGEGINKTWHWTPYFNNMVNLERGRRITKDIIFYGAMNRAENYDSVIWFIKNVFNEIDDNDVRFVIVGNKPPKELLELSNDRIIVTGFVDSVAPFFQTSLCCVAPLVMGAGVKIKVLEALSAGIPVLTNSIGIEGIPAQNGKEYLYCNSTKEYVESINSLITNPQIGSMLGTNAKIFISENYDYTRDAQKFIDKLEEI